MSLLRHPQSDVLPLAKTYEFPMETSPPTSECNVTILSVFPEGYSAMNFFFLVVVFHLIGFTAEQTCERPIFKVNDGSPLTEVTR